MTVEFRPRLTKAHTFKADEVIKANQQVKVISIDCVLGRYDEVFVAEDPAEET